MVYRRATLVWLVIVGAEVVHGILRGWLLQPIVGDLRARQVGVFTGSAIILLVAWTFVRWLGTRETGELLKVGLLWLVLMLSFEILLGRLVLGFSWQRLWQDYDLSQGGLMPVGMLVLLLSPWLAARMRENA